MPANGTNTQPRASTTAGRTQSTATRPQSDGAAIREGLTKARNGSVSYARQTAERTVDVPVGAALTVADRVNEIVEPFTARRSAERELKSIRTRVERELNRLERRGASARRKARTARAPDPQPGRARAQAAPPQVETTVKQNRVKAEDGLKRAQTAVQSGSRRWSSNA